MECPLIQLDNGKWHCPVCDPDKQRLLPVKAHRNCGPGPPYRNQGPNQTTHAKSTRPRHNANQRNVAGQPLGNAALESTGEELGIKPEHIVHYAQAIARWIAAGRPKRTDEEVEECLAICKACKHYTENGRCRKCGCCANRSKMAVLNKCRMATEHCEIGKW